MTTRDVNWRFGGDNRDLRRAADGAEDALQGVERASRRASQGVSQNLDRMSKNASRSSGLLAGALGSLTKASVFGLGAVGTAGVGMAGYLGLSFLKVEQQAKTAFTSMLGDGGKARAFLDNLAQFAKSTPFEFPELITTSQKLLAMGFAAEEVIPSLTAIGDATASLAGGPEVMSQMTRALGQMQIKGRASAEEMLQLSEAGINGWKYLADAMNTTVADAQEQVTKRMVDGRFAVKAILAGMTEDFGGQMEAQSHTFAGLWSTIKDTISQTAGTVMRPLFEAVTRGMQRVADFTSSPEFEQAVGKAGDFVRQRVLPAIQRLIDLVVDNKGAIVGFFSGVFEVAQSVATIAGTVFRGLDRISDAVGGWGELLKLAAAGWVAWKVTAIASAVQVQVANTIAAAGVKAAWRAALISTGFGALVAAAGLAAEYVITHWDKVKGWFAIFWKQLRNTGEAAWGLLKETARGTVYALLQYASAAIRGILELASHLPIVGDKARAALDKIDGYIETWKPEFRKAITDAFAEAGDAGGQAFYFASTSWVEKALSVSKSFGGGAQVPVGPVAPGDVAGTVAQAAQQFGPGGSQSGIYVFGAVKPGEAFDCSGLIVAAYARAGITLPHNAALQFRHSDAVDVTGQERAGDAVYKNVSNPTGGQGNPGHCGIYLGNDRIVEYYTAGEPPRINSLSAWKKAGAYAGARRWYKVKPGSGGANVAQKPPAATDPKPNAGAGAGNGAASGGLTIPTIDVPTYDPLTGSSSGKGETKAEKKKREEREAKERETRLRTAFEKAQTDGLARIARAREQTKKALSLTNLNIAVGKQAEALADIVGDRMPKSIQAKLLPQLRRIQAEIANRTVGEEGIERIKRQMQRVREVIAQQVTRAADEVRSRRSVVSAAFEQVASRVLRVFDAQTAKLVASASAAVAGFGFTTRDGEETPSEKALREFRDSRSIAERLKEKADLEARLANAETEDEKRQAQEELARLALDEREQQLQEAADAERKAADEALAAERTRIEDERGLVRDRFTARLQQVVAGWDGEKSTTAQKMAELQAVLDDPQWETGFRSAGELIGSAFAEGMMDAVSSLQAAIDSLASSVNAYRQVAGLQPIVPNTPVLKTKADIMVARGFASGGAYLGRKLQGTQTMSDSIVAPVRPGEVVATLDDLAKAWSQVIGGGVQGPTIQVTVPGAVLLGRDRDVAARIAEAVAPEIDRLLRVTVS